MKTCRSISRLSRVLRCMALFLTAAAAAGALAGCTPPPSTSPSPSPSPSPVDIWFEIDYGSAHAVNEPGWSFSATPGWAAADWAPDTWVYPEVWDVNNNIEVVNDHIGWVADIESSGVLMVMIGLTKLTSYSLVTVRVEGRSLSASSSVIFDVYNAYNTTGTSATMAHDWSVHTVDVELGTALVTGVGLQGIRVAPSGGSSALGLQRMRVTIHDAVW